MRLSLIIISLTLAAATSAFFLLQRPQTPLAPDLPAITDCSVLGNCELPDNGSKPAELEVLPIVDNATKTTEFGIPVTFAIADQRNFPDGLTLTLKQIGDSRCKPGVVCIWAGELNPNFIIEQSDTGIMSEITLGSLLTPVLESNSYVFTLTNTSADEATIIVEKIAPPTISKEPTANRKPLLNKVTTKTPPASPTQLTASTDFIKDVADLIHNQTNDFRKSHNLPSLIYQDTLEKNATAYSRNLLKNNYLSHTDTLGCNLSCRFKRDNYKASAWGENLAHLTFSAKPSAQYVADFFVKEWQKSAGHRENLLGANFTHQGIGISISEGAIYVVVHFAQPN